MPETTTEHSNSNQKLVLEQTVRTLAALNTLLTNAAECSNTNGLIFHILNHTVSYIPYDRAILLSAGGRKILGVSGTSKPAKHSELAGLSAPASPCPRRTRETQIINDDSFQILPDFWEKYTRKAKAPPSSGSRFPYRTKSIAPLPRTK